MEVRYFNFNDPSVQNQARTLIDGVLPMIPSWVREIEIYFQAANPETYIATVSTDVRYRRMSVTLFPLVFTYSPQMQREAIVHEFNHALSAELVEWVRKRVIEPMEEVNKEVFSYLNAEFVDKVERMVQEFTFVINGLLPAVGSG